MKRFLIAGNWKMNAPESGEKFADALNATLRKLKVKTIPGFEVLICPPAPYITDVAHLMPTITVGAQDVSEHDSGAYTGEVSASMLTCFGAKYAIVGHSERRAYHGETDALVNRKVKTALTNGLTPIICVGETLTEREENRTLDVLSAQVRGAFEGLSQRDAERVVLAYEPVWAIGTGVAASPNDAQAGCGDIRAFVEELFGDLIADGMLILYGGSMNAKNAAELLDRDNIDGGLIGGASLDADAFAAIVAAAVEITNKG